MTTVCAVVPEGAGPLDTQTAPVHALVREDDVVGRGLRRALAEPVEWLWLLDGSATPAPDALERLLAALAAPVAPVVLAGKVVAADGALAAGHAPWPRRGATELAMALAPHGLLAIRAARGGSLLVARAAAARTAGPVEGLPASAAALEWTARLLRRDVGVLVTGSVCTAIDPGPPATEVLSSNPDLDLRAGVAMLSGSGWYPKEKLWLGAEVAERAGRSLRGHPLRLARAAVGGWRARR